MTASDDVVSGAKRKFDRTLDTQPIELHTGEKPRLEWLLDGYYDIAYGNLWQGAEASSRGRCLSAEHEAMASARVTARCFSYGQAIGVAAAMCLRNDERADAQRIRAKEALRKDERRDLITELDKTSCLNSRLTERADRGRGAFNWPRNKISSQRLLCLFQAITGSAAP